MSFLSGHCQPNEMRKREKEEGETEVEVTAFDKSKYFLLNFFQFYQFYPKMSLLCESVLI